MHPYVHRACMPFIAASLVAVPSASTASEKILELQSSGSEVSVKLPAGTRDVDLVDQTKGNCRLGRTWGFDLSRLELWASGGCGGKFRATGDLAEAGGPKSSNAGMAVAAAAALAGVALLAHSRHKSDDNQQQQPEYYPPQPVYRPGNGYYPPQQGYRPPSGYYPQGGGRQGSIHGAGGLCLDMRGKEVRQGTDAIVFRCNGGPNQRFEWTPRGELRVAGMCLDVKNNDRSNGAGLVAWPCNGGANQQWNVNGSMIRSVQSGRCLDIRDGNATAGQSVIVWDCHGSANQRWWW